MKAQFEMGLIGPTFVLQALNDGQHPPAGIGAREPSGQILISIVQNILAQLGFNGKIAPYVTPRVISKQMRNFIFVD
jgi:hypothetical protein